MLGNCVWNMTPDLTVPPLGPDESWDSARGMLLAQASFCYRQALALAPEDVGALMSLHDAMKARRMRDAQQAVVSRMRHGRTAAGDTTTDQRVDSDKGPIPAPPDLDNLPGVIARLLEQGRPLQAVQLFLEAEGRGVVAPWPVRDQVAAILLHLGYPADARRFWEHGTDCPSRALRLARLATASLAECDFPTAQDGYLAALEIDPTLADAWLALALLNVERGQATPALTAAREGLRRPITPVQKAFLTGLEELVARHASIP